MTAVMGITVSDNGYSENDNELLWEITAYIFAVGIGVFPLMYLTSVKSKKLANNNKQSVCVVLVLVCYVAKRILKYCDCPHHR